MQTRIYEQNEELAKMDTRLHLPHRLIQTKLGVGYNNHDLRLSAQFRQSAI